MDLQRGFRIGRWGVYPLTGEICADDASVHVEPKVMEVLVALAEQAQTVVRREELTDRVWGTRAEVADEPLTRCIAQLRRAFGDSARNPEYVKTVHTIGYGLLKPVEPLDADSAARTATDDAAIAVVEREAGVEVAASADADTSAGHDAPGELLVSAALPADRGGFTTRWLALAVAAATIAAIFIGLQFIGDRPAKFALAPIMAQPNFEQAAVRVNNLLYEFFTGVPSLPVTWRETIPNHFDKGLTYEQIAEEEGLTHMLVGDLFSLGEFFQLSISVNNYLQARPVNRTFDVRRDLTDLRPVAVEICKFVGPLVRDDFATADCDRNVGLESDNPLANDAYWDAYEIMKKRSLQGLDSAREQLLYAIELEPDFTAACLLLARATALLPSYGGAGASRGQFYEEARSYLHQCADDAPGRYSVEAAMFNSERRWTDAHEAYERVNALAVQSSGPDPDWLQVQSQFLSATGRRQQALDMAFAAQKIASTSPVVNQRLAIMLTFAGREDEAKYYFERADDYEIDPGANLKARLVYWMRTGDYDRFEESLRLVLSLGGPESNRAWVDAFVDYFRAKDKGEAMASEYRDTAVALLQQSSLVDTELLFGAWVYLEQWDEALAVARSVLPDESFSLEMVFSEDATGLRLHPDFPQLLEQFGVVSFWRDNGISNDFCVLDKDTVTCDR